MTDQPITISTLLKNSKLDLIRQIIRKHQAIYDLSIHQELTQLINNCTKHEEAVDIVIAVGFLCPQHQDATRNIIKQRFNKRP